MIEYKNTHDKQASLRAEGNDRTLFADTVIMIRMVYDTIKAKDPEAAEIYRLAISTVLTDDNGPFFEEVEG